VLGGDEGDFMVDLGVQLRDRERVNQPYLSPGEESPDAEDEGRVRSVSVEDPDSVRSDHDGL